MKTPRIAMALFALPFAGCVSISSMQSARPIQQGEWNGFGAIGYESLKINDTSSSDQVVKDAVQSVKVPLIEGGARFGVAKNLDLGVKYTLPATLEADAKYMFVNLPKFAMSTGLGAAYASIKTGTGDQTSNTTFIDLHVPLYMSYDITDTTALHFTPTYILRHTSTSGTSSSIGMVGATVGANFHWFMAEAGYFTAPSSPKLGMMQIMIGYWGGYDKLQRASEKSSSAHGKHKTDSESQAE